MTELLGLGFGLVAFLYAMVGHGGASGYLALGSMAGMDLTALKGQALTLNLIVAAFSAYAYTKEGYLRWKVLLPLVVFSVPASFLGARITLNPAVTKLLLGLCLLAASFRMFFHFWLVRKSGQISAVRLPMVWVLALVGIVLGLLSGLTGVGGGIYLSPLLLLAGWATVKETAALSAWFIWLNSAAGLAGMASGIGIPYLPPEWIIPAALGGFLGANLGAQKLGEMRLRQALALVLLMAAYKLIVTGARGL